jgi:hypothetical protein
MTIQSDSQPSSPGERSTAAAPRDNGDTSDARALTPKTRARERRLQRIVNEEERGKRIQQQSEERQFVTSLNREVQTIRNQRLRGDATRAKQADARARREAKKTSALEALNAVERRLHMAPTGKSGKSEGMTPQTTANGSIQAPGKGTDTSGTPRRGESPPQPLLPLNELSIHRRTFHPSQHLVATPRTSAASYLPPMAASSPPKRGSDDGGDEHPLEESKHDAMKRELLSSAAQRVLALHKKQAARVEKAERSEASASRKDAAAQQRFGRA